MNRGRCIVKLIDFDEIDKKKNAEKCDIWFIFNPFE